jgi:broad specificity phosphatase PhoE
VTTPRPAGRRWEGADERPPERYDTWLARHGETEWARLGRHTSRTDIPLTDAGREQARELGRRLAGHDFALVLTSPLSRAADTAAIAGFGDRAIVDDDLREWDYGAFEGRLTAEIRTEHPGWTIWRGPWDGGERIEDVTARADRVVDRLQAAPGESLVFGHGHMLRVITARWLGLAATAGQLFALSTATLSVIGWERETAVIEAWNEDCRDG